MFNEMQQTPDPLSIHTHTVLRRVIPGSTQGYLPQAAAPPVHLTEQAHLPVFPALGTSDTELQALRAMVMV